MNTEPTSTPAHEPRLNRELRALLASQRVASLGTLNSAGKPFVSMVPFAIEPHSGTLVIHVSQLATHTPNLLADPVVSVMVMQAEVAGAPVQALPRVSFDGVATRLEPNSAAWQAARSAYLTRFPEAEPITELGDFSFVAISLTQARQVAGFGAARSLAPEDLVSVLKPL